MPCPAKAASLIPACLIQRSPLPKGRARPFLIDRYGSGQDNAKILIRIILVMALTIMGASCKGSSAHPHYRLTSNGPVVRIARHRWT